MTEKFKIDITTPGKLVFSGEVEMATIPGEDGEFGVLAGHSAVISNLQAGVVKIYANDNVESRIFVAGGFAEVNEMETSVLATEAYDLSKVTKVGLEEKIAQATTAMNTAETEFDKRRAREEIALNQQIISLL